MPKAFNAFSYIKFVILWTVILVIGIGAYIFWNFQLSSTSATIKSEVEFSTDEAPQIGDEEYEGIEAIEDQEGDGIANAGFVDKETERKALTTNKSSQDPTDKTKNFSILILGIDRRHGGETHWRTDVIQLLTLSPDRTKGVVTHIPRDVWANNYKINAIYNLKGADAIKDEVQKITGQRPDRIIRVDFDAFVWVIDSIGGITLTVPNEFIDEEYPADRSGSNEYETITFTKGLQEMDGETALKYVRSRHGTNGEGSDYARGARQQLVMKELADDFFDPNNLFSPKTPETLYRLATQKIYTNLSIGDTKVLFELLKNYKNISIDTISVDTSNYVEVPADKSLYGGAWTLVPKGGDFTALHNEIQGKLQ